MTDLVLTAGDFRTWLLARDESAVVGKANDVCECPLACFLNERGQGQVMRVVGEYCSVYDESGCLLETASLPAWAGWFVSLVDRGRDFGAPVSREAALSALDMAVQEVGSDEFDA